LLRVSADPATRCIISDYYQVEFLHLASWDTVQLQTLTSSLTSISTTNHHLLCKRSLNFEFRDKRRYGNAGSSQQRANFYCAVSLTIMPVYTNYAMPEMPKKISNSSSSHH
jgi:hypothetical protein